MFATFLKHNYRTMNEFNAMVIAYGTVLILMGVITAISTWLYESMDIRRTARVKQGIKNSYRISATVILLGLFASMINVLDRLYF